MSPEAKRFRLSLLPPFWFVLIIWLIKIVEITFQWKLVDFGIRPRTLEGIIGIISSPFIHGDIYHLLANSLPFFVLGTAIFYFYQSIAWRIWLMVHVLSGAWVWLAGREASHIGASGVVYGFIAFLLVSGFIRRDTQALAISFIILFLYGTTLFSGIIPGDLHISWESHLMGAVAGIIAGLYYRNVPIYKGPDQLQTKDHSYSVFNDSDKEDAIATSEMEFDFTLEFREKEQD